MSDYTPPPEGYKLCTRCGITQRREAFSREARARDGLRSWCKSCCSEYHREYRKEHRDDLNQASSDYYRANRSRLLSRARLRYFENKEAKADYDRWYRERNKGMISSRRRRYYKANVEKIAQYKREYYRKNAPKVREKVRRWHEENPDKAREHSNLRRARKVHAWGSHTADDARDIFERQGGTCLYCGKRLDKAAHLDHFIPLSRGGRNSRENLAWACSSCNRSKGAQLPWNWHGWGGETPVFWDGGLF